MHRPGQNGEDAHQERRREMRASKPEVRDLEGPWPGSLWVGLAVIALTIVAAVWASLEFRTNGFSLTLSLIIYMLSNLQMLVRSIAYHDGAHGLLHSDSNKNFLPLVHGNDCRVFHPLRYMLLLSTFTVFSSGFQDQREHKEHHAKTYSEQDPDTQFHHLESQGWWRLFWLVSAPLPRAWELLIGWFYALNPWNCDFLPSLYIFASQVSLFLFFTSVTGGALGLEVNMILALAWCIRDWTPAGFLVVAMHFSHSDDQATWSTYDLPRCVELLMGNLAYHVEHHDFQRVSWWHLPKLHEMFKENDTGKGDWRGYRELTAFNMGSFFWDFYIRRSLRFNQAFHWSTNR